MGFIPAGAIETSSTVLREHLSLSCHHKIPEAEWLGQQILILSQSGSWKTEFRVQFLAIPLFLACRCLPSLCIHRPLHCIHTESKLSGVSAYKGSSPTRTPSSLISFNLNYLPLSNYPHLQYSCVEVWGGRLQHMNWEGTQFCVERVVSLSYLLRYDWIVIAGEY